jgi:hypothetical protein
VSAENGSLTLQAPVSGKQVAVELIRVSK